jgi:hypothetical protein
MNNKPELLPVSMYIYWKAVMDEANRRLKTNYRQRNFFQEVYIGAKNNKKIESVLDDCIDRVNRRWQKRGIRPKKNIVPKNTFSIDQGKWEYENP